jgi:protein involved in polysaccharide export with SLBB domain
MSGDIVTVSEAFPVYVIGGVNAPQQISLRNQMTVSRVIAMAGGLAKDFEGIVTIFRRDNRETKRIEADIKKITAGQAEDTVLKPFDIVDVPQKGKAVRTRPPSIDNGRLSGSALSSLPLRIID